MSCSANALLPDSWVWPPPFASCAARSKIVVPVRRVWRNASSSAYATREIRSQSERRSVYVSAILSRLTGISSGSAGSSYPSSRIERTARRSSRRST